MLYRHWQAESRLSLITIDFVQVSKTLYITRDKMNIRQN